MTGTTDRLATAAGAGWVALVLAGNTITESGAPVEDTPEAAAAWFALQREGGHQLGLPLELLGFVLMAVFVARLVAVLRRAEGPGAWLPGLALAGGLVTLAVKLGSAAPVLVGYAVDDLPAEQAQLLLRLNDGAFLVSALTTGVLLLGVAGSALRSGVLPRWFAWLGAALGWVAVLGSVVPPDTLDGGPGVLGFLLGLLWLGATSLLLALRTDRAGAAAGQEAVLARA